MQYDYHSCPYEPDTGVPPLRGNGRVQNLHMVQSCGHTSDHRHHFLYQI